MRLTEHFRAAGRMKAACRGLSLVALHWQPCCHSLSTTLLQLCCNLPTQAISLCLRFNRFFDNYLQTPRLFLLIIYARTQNPIYFSAHRSGRNCWLLPALLVACARQKHLAACASSMQFGAVCMAAHTAPHCRRPRVCGLWRGLYLHGNFLAMGG